MSMYIEAKLGLVSFIIFSGIVLASCSSDSNSNTISSSNEYDLSQADYMKVSCTDVIPQELLDLGVLGDDSVECGYVTVPANWSQPDSDNLKLAVYKIPATTSTPSADPVVYLEGGPGGAGVGTISYFTVGEAAYLRDRSDIYVVDQRGTGYSEPALYCSEVFQAEVDEKEGAELIASYKACHDRLISSGVNFGDYNSHNNALDVSAIRHALEINEWNLYGLSYGTRLALTIMRDAPAGVRSVVLDSVFPPEINGISEADYPLYYTINQIASNCAADADCTANIGDIKALIESAIARLDAQPIGELTASLFIELLAENITDPSTASGIRIVAEGSEAEVLTLLDEINAEAEDETSPTEVPSSFYPFVAEEAQAMFFAVVCAEEAPYLNDKASPVISYSFTETTQRVINADVNLNVDAQLEVCAVFNVPPAGEIETKTVNSDIPTLVLAGTADVVTPPAWSILAADSLPNSQYAEFDGLGHGLIGNNPCLNDITTAFLNNTAVEADQACIMTLPLTDYVTE